MDDGSAPPLADCEMMLAILGVNRSMTTTASSPGNGTAALPIPGLPSCARRYVRRSRIVSVNGWCGSSVLIQRLHGLFAGWNWLAGCSPGRRPAPVSGSGIRGEDRSRLVQSVQKRCEHMLFMRLCVISRERLLAGTHFRNPNTDSAPVFPKIRKFETALILADGSGPAPRLEIMSHTDATVSS